MAQWQDIHQYVTRWLKEAREQIIVSLQKNLAISTKSNKNDLVTEVDKNIERFFIEKIRSTFPDHRILGEEGFGDEITSTDGTIWLIDPIDGTLNFVHQKLNFMISIAIYENGSGISGYIYDVIRDELYYAIRGKGAYFQDTRLSPLEDVPLDEALIGINGTWLVDNKRVDHRLLTPIVHRAHGIRSYGSAAMEMAYVATGRLNAYLSFKLMPWDFAAGKIIVEELGGKATTAAGEELTIFHKGSVLIASPALHEHLLNHYLTNFTERN